MALSYRNLSKDDIEFLRSVQEVSDNPDAYDMDVDAEGPVTTSFLIQNTTLSRMQVRYRMARPSDARDGRGFTEANLIRVYDGMLQPNGRDGPKSCEITDEGRRLLSEAENNASVPLQFQEGASTDTAENDDRLDQIEQDIERLDNQFTALGEKVTDATEQMDELSSTLQEIQEGDYGAVDPEVAEQLKDSVNAIITFSNMFDYVFGANLENFNPAMRGNISPEEVAQEREHIFNELQETSPDEVRATLQKFDDE